MAGGNASIHLVDCNASTGGSPPLAQSIGARIAGGIADTFLIRLETSSLARGIVVDGQLGELSKAEQRIGHVGLHIDSPVLDQCRDVGIAITGLSDHAICDIRDAYIAIGPGSGTAVALVNCGGNIDLNGGQLIGITAADSTEAGVGISIINCRGVAITGAKLLGFSAPMLAERLSSFEIAVAVNEPERQTGVPAIQLLNCAHGYCRPRITGRPGAFAGGVVLTGARIGVSIEGAAIDPTVTGGL